jgi:hypothetical protein
MRNGETHFEQVPIDVVKSVVREAAELARMLEKSSALVLELKRPSVEEFLKQEEKVPGGSNAKDEPRIARRSEI